MPEKSGESPRQSLSPNRSAPRVPRPCRAVCNADRCWLCLHSKRGVREERDDAPTGVVARRQRGRLSVVFDEPPPDWATEGRVVVELQASSATYDRL